jgi:hypothetical protein
MPAPPETGYGGEEAEDREKTQKTRKTPIGGEMRAPQPPAPALLPVWWRRQYV